MIKNKERLFLDKLEDKKQKVWGCKIGYAEDVDLPSGADSPMKKAITKAFKEITGYEPDFIFSGWGATLTEGEQECVNELYPNLKN